MAKRETNAIALELTRDFLQAIMERKDWHEFSSVRSQKMTGAPNMPTFTAFKAIRTGNPGHGYDPEQVRCVYLELTLGGMLDKMKRQIVPGKILVVREIDWEPCPKCDGTAPADDSPLCEICGGTGKKKLDLPRIPVKGSEHYANDVEHGKWGVAPYTFEYMKGARLKDDI